MSACNISSLNAASWYEKNEQSWQAQDSRVIEELQNSREISGDEMCIL